MSRIVISQELKEKLQGVDNVAELCDEAGHVLGCFVPQSDRSMLEPQVGEEELHRRELSTEPRYTTKEVLAYLEKL